MSQYPSPYPGPYAYPAYAPDPYAAALAPARRAGILMIVMGVLILGMGLCTSVTLMGPEEMIRKQIEMMPSTPDAPMTVEGMRRQSLISVIGLGLLGVALLVLGIFVRRGGKGAAITGIVLSALALLQLGIGMLGALLLAAGAPIMILGACIVAVPLALFVLLLVWLIQSLRASSEFQRMQAQYQQQYYQYQYQQQMYSQPGYGYQTPPVPPRPDQSGAASHDPPAPGTS